MTRITTTDGVELTYERTGRGPCLVLVHGSWSDGSSWAPLVAHLSAHADVVTYDRRGHGASGDGPGPGRIAEDATDLCCLAEALDAGRVHLVGNSLGASIALAAAARRPDLVRTVSAHEPPLHAVLDDPSDAVRRDVAVVVASVETALRAIRAGDDERGARAFMEGVAFGPGAWEQLPDALRRTFVANAPTFLDEQEDPAWSSLDVDRLAAGGVPVQLTVGGDTRPAHSGPAEALAARLPIVRLTSIDGAGHVPHVTHPAVLAAALISFVAADEVGAGTGRPPGLSD